MILVDSSVWIDFFRGDTTPEVELLDSLLDRERLAVGDLVLTEVLQGFRGERGFDLARKTLDVFTLVELGGKDVAVQAARNFRTLRGLGVEVRKDDRRHHRDALHFGWTHPTAFQPGLRRVRNPPGASGRLSGFLNPES